MGDGKVSREPDTVNKNRWQMFNRGPETESGPCEGTECWRRDGQSDQKGHEKGRETFRRQILHTTAKVYVKAS